MSIAENLKNLKLQISINCQKAGREADSCTLIAVSKTKPLEQITEAISAGQKHFGENYVQEALQKISNFSKLESPPIWHFIGHLQSNKAHQVVGAFHLIHSVDRISLAKVLNQEAKKKNIVQSILLQINVGD